jgi:hypothetical protein
LALGSDEIDMTKFGFKVLKFLIREHPENFSFKKKSTAGSDKGYLEIIQQLQDILEKNIFKMPWKVLKVAAQIYTLLVQKNCKNMGKLDALLRQSINFLLMVEEKFLNQQSESVEITDTNLLSPIMRSFQIINGSLGMCHHSLIFEEFG